MTSLIGTAAALAAVTGIAAVAAPGGTPETPGGATRLPVQRSALLCPPPTSSDVGETTYTAFVPGGAAAGADTKKGTAKLLPAGTVKDAGAGDGKQKGGKGKAPDTGRTTVPPPDTKPV